MAGLTATKETTKTPKKTVTKAKKDKSSVGAPSQLKQTSRKGKRAWRKNVDIEDVEEGLEGMRAEERVTGTALQKMRDEDLFVVDVQPDEKARHNLPRFSSSQLTSTKILAERSAVPAVFSRPSSSVTKRKALVSHEDKERLSRIGKRQRKGPFNSVVDPTEFGAGSSIVELSEAVKASGTYDAWAPEEEQEEIPDGLETVQKKTIKPPTHKHPRDVIEVPAIVEPHQGTSYNPPADSHQELLLKAHEIEEKRSRDAEKLAETKAKIESARREVEDGEEGVAAGMKVQLVPIEDDEQQDEVLPQKKMPERKTKAQRNKAARLLAEKRALAEKAAKKRLHATIGTVKLLRRTADQTLSAREKERIEKLLAQQEKLKLGLAGTRLGKHKVPEGQLDVQLGEELSESLRGLKPEGNLFRDRFLSLQQRALIEPRVPVLPKKRRNRVIEFEKHAWKRFE